jgi:arylsulfatase A-like enzyme
VSPSPGAPGASHPGERPNVLILLADQLRADVLGVNGSPTCRTPYLDALAAGGASFATAYTTTPLCSPARGALFTGRYPHSNGLTANTHYPETPTPRLGPGERTLFEHLAPAGYRAGYAGKWRPLRRSARACRKLRSICAHPGVIPTTTTRVRSLTWSNGA